MDYFLFSEMKKKTNKIFRSKTKNKSNVHLKMDNDYEISIKYIFDVPYFVNYSNLVLFQVKL